VAVQLHRRLALRALLVVGSHPTLLMAGFIFSVPLQPPPISPSRVQSWNDVTDFMIYFIDFMLLFHELLHA
jgi:hypothetical protein